MSTRSLLVVSVSLLLAASSLQAEDAAASAAVADAAAAETLDVGQLIPLLDDAEFTQRQVASQRLLEAGKAVFPDLEKAALEGSREAGGRVLEILKSHFSRGNDETKTAAKEALERLARSGNAGIAQRAGEVLHPPQPSENVPGGFFAAPAFRNNIQIQVAAGNLNGGRRVSTRRDANGKIEIEAQENGKKTKIVKQPNGSIEIEITETQNGKETTRKVEAKDLDDLKKKDADAAKTYEQYSQNGIGNLRIQAGLAPGFPGAVPGLPAPGAALPAELAKRHMETLERQIELYKARLPNDPNAQRIIDSLERTRQRMKELQPAEVKPSEPAKPAEKPADAPGTE